MTRPQPTARPLHGVRNRRLAHAGRAQLRRWQVLGRVHASTLRRCRCPLEARSIPVADAGVRPRSSDQGNDVGHTPAAPTSPDSNSSRCQRSTRASTSTMSHQLAASRGLPQTAPGLAMQATVASHSYDSPGTGRTRARRGAVEDEERRFMRVPDEPERAHRAVGQDRSGRRLGEEPEEGVARRAVPAVDAVTAGLGAARQPEHVASAVDDVVWSERPGVVIAGDQEVELTSRAE